MRHVKKLIFVSITCAGVIMALLLTVVLTTRLLANRDTVRSLIVTKTFAATGAALSYDRLTVGFFPLPHLQAQGIQLHRPDTFDIIAEELAVYTRILPLLTGQISIRRLVLNAPDIRIALSSSSAADQTSVPSNTDPVSSLEEALQASSGVLFGLLASIEPGTDMLIQSGTVTLSFNDAPDILISGIQLYGANDAGDLSLTLECRSALTGQMNVDLQADRQKRTAGGKVHLTDLDLRPLGYYATLPEDIRTGPTHAQVDAAFTIANPETLEGHFNLRFPNLTILRNGRKLDLASVVIAGELAVGEKGLTLSVDTLQSARPALSLSAGAVIRPADETGPTAIELHAAAQQLDVAVAGQVTQAIVGDLKDIRTAFAVAKEGILTGATYDVRFESTKNGYALVGMNASGHLTGGRVTIPGIDADLERMDGGVVYQDSHVAFNSVSGYFKGATFEKLDATIDWAAAATLSIASTAVSVEAKTFSSWLLPFEGLAGMRKYVDSIDGTAQLSRLTIDGPLTDPAKWTFKICGTPEKIQLASPLVPFETHFSGGEIVWVPNGEQATDVAIEFLDGALVASYHARGIIDPEAISCRLDGTLGSEAVAWLTSILPIPEHLQLNPPVDLSGVTLAWFTNGKVSLTGTLKTAGNVELFADASLSPEDWDIRRIEFSDGNSQVSASVRKAAERIEVAFTGNVEKTTADRILADNRSLSGRLEGNFRAIFDTRRPMESAFAGRLSGQGLQIHELLVEPVEIKHFSVDGSAGQLAIAPSEIKLYGSRLIVDGTLKNRSGDVTVDLHVDADRLDAELIRAIQSMGPATSGAAQRERTRTPRVKGAVHIRSDEFAFGKWIWSPVEADVRIGADAVRVQIDRADLCGIGTTGVLEFSPRGMDLTIAPQANRVSLQETADCLWHRPVRAEARYDLSGEIRLPAGPHDPLQFMTGELNLASQNGRITYSHVLMKVFSVLNVTEVFAGGTSDLTENGYGYSMARVTAAIGGGKLHFKEILMDGNSLKITGQGSIDLKDQQVDITLLAAPLKTVDRIVNKIPIINYIAGGSLISIPLRVHGKMDSLAVATMPPSAVGQGLLNIMGRTLKAPFKLVEGAADLASEAAAQNQKKPADTRQKGP